MCLKSTFFPLQNNRLEFDHGSQRLCQIRRTALAKAGVKRKLGLLEGSAECLAVGSVLREKVGGAGRRQMIMVSPGWEGSLFGDLGPWGTEGRN